MNPLTVQQSASEIIVYRSQFEKMQNDMWMDLINSCPQAVIWGFYIIFFGITICFVGYIFCRVISGFRRTDRMFRNKF